MVQTLNARGRVGWPEGHQSFIGSRSTDINQLRPIRADLLRPRHTGTSLRAALGGGRRSNTSTTTDTFACVTELVAAVDNWMNCYNPRRRHSTIGMLSPTNYEQSLTARFMAA
ncbi:hypothetical protein RQCS_62310 (plasmid) [Rhodococcus qingshengii]|uniref:IS3 family transposase n=1 Tax=Rhodococcus qingshengii TaxID=334542 RepID=UPI000B22C435|nr:IS3 family transposase [Rhodococcus qingshengii]BCF86686.1 hypothetical protein RQCS_62310 [Rhodococcus qingshengii]